MRFRSTRIFPGRVKRPPVPSGTCGRRAIGGVIMWIRNLIFLGLVLGGFAALSVSLSPPELTPPPARHGVVPTPTVAPRSIVAEVNAAFRQQWSDAGVTPAER